MPLLNRVVELQAGIGALPGGNGNLLPEIARFDALYHVARRARGQNPVVVAIDRVEEAVGQPNRVVRVLARNRNVGFGVPAGVVLLDFDSRIALTGVVERVLRGARRKPRGDRFADRVAQRRVERRIEPSCSGYARVVRCGNDRVEAAVRRCASR